LAAWLRTQMVRRSNATHNQPFARRCRASAEDRPIRMPGATAREWRSCTSNLTLRIPAGSCVLGAGFGTGDFAMTACCVTTAGFTGTEAGDTKRLHDKAIRRWTYVIEGLTSYQRQFRVRAGVEHPYILRLHDTSVFYLIAVSARSCLKLDHVIPGNVPQTAE
jgi:hypothetical protein